MILLLLLSSQLMAQEVSFPTALHEMVETNVDVRIQKTKLSASDSLLLAAKGAFTPTLNLQAQQQNSGGNTAPPVSGFNPYPTAQVYSANATWNLFRSGADLASLRAAQGDRSYQMSLLDSAYLQAEDKAVRALVDLIQQKKQVESFQRSEVSAKHFFDIALARFKRSLLAREEEEKVAIDAGNSEAKRSDAEIAFNQSRATVAALLGSDQVHLEWPWMERLNLKSVENLLKDDGEQFALDHRPEILAARASLESEDQHSRSLFRSMLPSFDLGYSVGETHLRGQIISGWSSLATLTIPLWNGLHDYAAYRVQVESKTAAESRVKQAERDVRSSVRPAQDNYRISVEQYQIRLSNLKTAHHILEQDEARFKMGRADANELNLDLRRVTDAEILSVQGLAQAHLAYMLLLHAFGLRASP